MRKLVLALLASVTLSGCAIQREADLIPTNPAASIMGVLHARFIAYGTGDGEAQLTMPDGDILLGRYHIDREPIFGFGNIIRAAITNQGTQAMLQQIGGYQAVSPGTAYVRSVLGREGACEFYNNNINGHGFGACSLPDGALYRLQY